MAKVFQKVGVLGRRRAENIAETLAALIEALEGFGQAFEVDTELKPFLKNATVQYLPREKLAESCDLFIVVGGDGSLLHAAKLAAEHQIPVVGVNKGRLGFLTDIMPDELADRLHEVLAGRYHEEQRFLLEATIKSAKGKAVYRNTALNDVVLLPGAIAHMIEFEVRINDQLVLTQRSDGMIVATPTGSTAYALSGGGPILQPKLEAMVLVPMFPHTLSMRPIVVDSTSKLDIVIASSNETSPWVSCDGHEKVAIEPGSILHIQKLQQKLRLLHPENYNYYETLRTKLHWG